MVHSCRITCVFHGRAICDVLSLYMIYIFCNIARLGISTKAMKAVIRDFNQLYDIVATRRFGDVFVAELVSYYFFHGEDEGSIDCYVSCSLAAFMLRAICCFFNQWPWYRERCNKPRDRTMFQETGRRRERKEGRKV